MTTALLSYTTSRDTTLLIMGGGKLEGISGNELLNRYRQEFINRLAVPNTRLVVIGYGFLDEHINELLRVAATGSTNFQMFIIDTYGVDVLYNRPMSKSSVPPRHDTDKLLKALTPVLAGASRRPLASLFSHQNPDEIERSKVFRFLGI